MYMDASTFIWVTAIYIYMESGVLLLIKSIYIYILFKIQFGRCSLFQTLYVSPQKKPLYR